MKNPIEQMKKDKITSWISAIVVLYFISLCFASIYMQNNVALTMFLVSGATLGFFAWLGITPEWFAERWYKG